MAEENKATKAIIGLILVAFIGFVVSERQKDRGPGVGLSFDTSKFDAEEAGYHDEFNEVYTKASGYAEYSVRAIRDMPKYTGPQRVMRARKDMGVTHRPLQRTLLLD